MNQYKTDINNILESHKEYEFKFEQMNDMQLDLNQLKIDVSKLKRAKELITKEFEDKQLMFIERKMESHKAEIRSYLKSQKVQNTELQRKFINHDINMTNINGKINLIEKNMKLEMNSKFITQALSNAESKINKLNKQYESLNLTVNMNHQY